MEKRTRRLALVLGGGFLTTVGLVTAACSTDNGTSSNPLPGSDSGRDSSRADGNTDPGDTDGGNTPADAEADCANVPKVQSNEGVYCFGANPDGGKCGASQICCSDGRLSDGGFAPSTCEDNIGEATSGGGFKEGACTFPQGTDGGEEWHCTEASHCPNNGEVCCAIQDSVTGKNPEPPTKNSDFPGCEAYFNGGNFVGGTRCRADSCKAGESTLCASDNDCKAGKCVPIKIGNRFTGYCRVGAQ